MDMAALMSRVDVFSGNKLARFASAIRGAFPATVRVYIPGTRTYDAVNDVWNTSADVNVIASAPARIQRVRSGEQTNDAGNWTKVQSYLVSVPVENFSAVLERGMLVQVLSSPRNTDLTRYTMVVDRQADSSNPIERTFYCMFDLEA